MAKLDQVQTHQQPHTSDKTGCANWMSGQAEDAKVIEGLRAFTSQLREKSRANSWEADLLYTVTYCARMDLSGVNTYAPRLSRAPRRARARAKRLCKKNGDVDL